MNKRSLFTIIFATVLPVSMAMAENPTNKSTTKYEQQEGGQINYQDTEHKQNQNGPAYPTKDQPNTTLDNANKPSYNTRGVPNTVPDNTKDEVETDN